MIPEHVLLVLLIGHYIADFIIQTEEQAVNKSHSTLALTLHAMTYSYSMSMFVSAYLPIDRCFEFMGITFVIHWITDFFTSKKSSKYFGMKEYRLGFIIVGFDQILHYVQLYLTFKYLYI